MSIGSIDSSNISLYLSAESSTSCCSYEARTLLLTLLNFNLRKNPVTVRLNKAPISKNNEFCVVCLEVKRIVFFSQF